MSLPGLQFHEPKESPYPDRRLRVGSRGTASVDTSPELRLLAKHRIEEGIAACVKYTREQNPWASQERTPELMKILLTYGTHAKAVIPELEKLALYFEKDEKNFPRNLMLQKAMSVRDAIQAIQASTETPELSRIQPVNR